LREKNTVDNIIVRVSRCTEESSIDSSINQKRWEWRAVEAARGLRKTAKEQKKKGTAFKTVQE